MARDSRRRHAVVWAAGAVALAALAAGGWLGATRDSGYHEHHVLANDDHPGAGLGSDVTKRLLPYPRTYDTYAIDSPWSVDRVTDGGADEDGIAAHYLATSEEFWRYTRDGARVGQVYSTGAGPGTVAVWWRDGLLVALDSATGEPRWHHEVAYGDSSGRDAGLTVLSDLVLVARPGSVTAYGARYGKTVWTAKPPPGCSFTGRHHFLMKDAVVADVSCGSGRTSLAGYDMELGTRRWTVDTTARVYFATDDHTLAVYRAGGGDSAGELVDFSGDEPRTRPWPVKAPPYWVASDGGIALDGTGADGNGALTAYGVADARPHWTARPAPGTRFGHPVVSSKRIYVVQQPVRTPVDPSGGPAPGAGYHADLLVLDAATGKRLQRVEVPQLPMDPDALRLGYAATLDVLCVGPVVGIEWRATGSRPTHPTVVLLGG